MDACCHKEVQQTTLNALNLLFFCGVNLGPSMDDLDDETSSVYTPSAGKTFCFDDDSHDNSEWTQSTQHLTSNEDVFLSLEIGKVALNNRSLKSFCTCECKTQ